MTRAGLVAVAIVFLAGVVTGAILGRGVASVAASTPREPVPTVTQTVTEAVTEVVPILALECEKALHEAQIVLDAGLALSEGHGEMSQIISDSKRYISVHDVAGLSQAQADLIAFEKLNADDYHNLGIEAATLSEAMEACIKS